LGWRVAWIKPNQALEPKDISSLADRLVIAFLFLYVSSQSSRGGFVMEMQQVRYFLAVAKALNFTRAAEECNVTQPALTRAIKLLEYELGGDLIRREGRNSHLTELGNKMLPMLSQCYEAATSAKALAQAFSKGDVSTLAIGVARTIDPLMLMVPFREMYDMFPGLQLKLKRGTAAEIVDMLQVGQVDLAIGGPLGETWDRLETWPMFSESFDLIVGADHALTLRDAAELAVEHIHGERFLRHNGNDLTDYECERLGAAGIDLHTAHEVNSDRDLEALVVAGFGIAIAPRGLHRSAALRHIDFPGIDIQRPVAIYTVAGRQRSRETTALLSLLRAKDWSGE
jgi:DNA-binding transcriptional LysR family regulator